jgi:hypothetical protein
MYGMSHFGHFYLEARIRICIKVKGTGAGSASKWQADTGSGSASKCCGSVTLVGCIRSNRWTLILTSHPVFSFINWDTLRNWNWEIAWDLWMPVPVALTLVSANLSICLTFWYRSVSAHPYHRITDPDPALFFKGFHDAKKSTFLAYYIP